MADITSLEKLREDLTASNSGDDYKQRALDATKTHEASLQKFFADGNRMNVDPQTGAIEATDKDGKAYTGKDINDFILATGPMTESQAPTQNKPAGQDAVGSGRGATDAGRASSSGDKGEEPGFMKKYGGLLLAGVGALLGAMMGGGIMPILLMAGIMLLANNMFKLDEKIDRAINPPKKPNTPGANSPAPEGAGQSQQTEQSSPAAEQPAQAAGTPAPAANAEAADMRKPEAAGIDYASLFVGENKPLPVTIAAPNEQPAQAAATPAAPSSADTNQPAVSGAANAAAAAVVATATAVPATDSKTMELGRTNRFAKFGVTRDGRFTSEEKADVLITGTQDIDNGKFLITGVAARDENGKFAQFSTPQGTQEQLTMNTPGGIISMLDTKTKLATAFISGNALSAQEALNDKAIAKRNEQQGKLRAEALKTQVENYNSTHNKATLQNTEISPNGSGVVHTFVENFMDNEGKKRTLKYEGSFKDVKGNDGLTNQAFVVDRAGFVDSPSDAIEKNLLNNNQTLVMHNSKLEGDELRTKSGARSWENNIEGSRTLSSSFGNSLVQMDTEQKKNSQLLSLGAMQPPSFVAALPEGANGKGLV